MVDLQSILLVIELENLTDSVIREWFLCDTHIIVPDIDFWMADISGAVRVSWS